MGKVIDMAKKLQILTATHELTCSLCGGTIPSGTRYWHRNQVAEYLCNEHCNCAEYEPVDCPHWIFPVAHIDEV